MKLEKKLLSRRILAMYDYIKTKKLLLEWLEDTEMKKLELKSFYIPSSTRSYELREEQFVRSIISKESIYIDRKVDLEREIEDREKAISIAFDELLPIEQTIYKKAFEQNHSCLQMASDENTYVEYINQVKSSAVIKICIVLNIAVSKGKKESVK